MTPLNRIAGCLVVFLCAAGAAGAQGRDGFVPLFNGRNLNGWVNVNGAPETWSARNGVISCTGRPTGALRTARQYENFILELDWRHLTSGGNSGIFIWASPIAAPGVPFLRAIEVQVLDHGYNVPGKNEWYTTHGDVFPIHGSSMKPFGRHNGERSFPSEERSKPSPEWNHYRIVCDKGVLRLHVNGKEVSGGENCSYRKGYLGLEAEGAPVEFRNIQIQELPSSGTAPELTAPLDQGWRTLFNGLDLRGWKHTADGRWRVEGERMVLSIGGAPPDTTLWTERQYGNVELVLDCRATKPAADGAPPVASVILGGDPGAAALEMRLEGASPGRNERFTITQRGRTVTLNRGEQVLQRITLPADAPNRAAIGLRGSGAELEVMNVYLRELR